MSTNKLDEILERIKEREFAKRVNEYRLAINAKKNAGIEDEYKAFLKGDIEDDINNVGKIKKIGNVYRVAELKDYPIDAYYTYHNNPELPKDMKKPKKPVVRGLNDEKLPESISRTRSLIFELMMSNPWEFFMTLTLNGEKHARDDIDVFRNKFMVWLKNYNVRHKLSIKILFVPELHSDLVNYHGHGALMGLPMEHLTPYKLTDKLPVKTLQRLSMGYELYRWDNYSDKFGFSELSPIRSIEKSASYISKYVSKDVLKSPVAFNKRLFYASHGLRRAETLHIGAVKREFKPDFENDFVRIKTFQTEEEAMELFADDTSVLTGL